MMSHTTKSWGRFVLSCLGMGAGVVLASGQAFGQCAGQWDTSFRAANADGAIRASIMHDDGSGPALFVGGKFTTIGGTVAYGIAKTHDGVNWERVGDGPVLLDYPAAGTIWHNLPAYETMDMVSYDPDGAGPLRAVLVVAGSFEALNGFNLGEQYSVAAWNGTAWQTLGNGLPPIGGDVFSSPVQALAVVNHSGGARLYAGGDFATAEFDTELGWVTGRDVAVFDGTDWKLLGLTGTTTNARVLDLVAHDDGGGEDLYVSIQGSGIIGIPNTGGIARWDGSSWSSVGGGIAVPLAGSFAAYSNLVSFDADGPGGQPAKLLCFELDHVIYDGNLMSFGRVDTWNGASWNVATMPYHTTYGLSHGVLPVTDAGGRAVYFGVSLPPSSPDGLITGSLARYDGTSFSLVGPQPGVNPATLTLNTLDSPPTLFVGVGNIEPMLYGTGMLAYSTSTNQYRKLNTVMGAPADNFIETIESFSAYHPRYDETGGTTGAINDMTLFDPDGSDPMPEAEVIVGPYSIAGVVCNGVAIRSGASWAPLGDASVFVPAQNQAITLTHVMAMPTASGIKLYIAAVFSSAAGRKNGVFVLEGGVWQPVGMLWGIHGADPINEYSDIQSMVYADFGGGNQALIIGRFTRADGGSVANAAKWNGSAWVNAGTGLPNQSVFGRAVAHTNAAGPQVFTRGFRYDGLEWQSAMLGLPDVTLPQFVPISVVKFNGDVWAVRDWYDSESRVRNALYRWNDEAGWEFQSDVPPAGPTLYDETRFLGVANSGTGSGDRFYFGKLSTSTSAVSVSLIESDGYASTDLPDLGRFSIGFPTKVFGSTTRGEHSLWFLGTNGVGGENTPVHITTINAMDSYGIARWYCAVPSCPADYNQSGSVTVQDIFDFLAGWFAGSNAADFNNSGSVTVQDIFDFLAAWFSGCP